MCSSLPSCIIIFSPVLLVLAVLVRLFVGAPVLFWQERPGYKGRPFRIVKFRTMTEARDAAGRPAPRLAAAHALWAIGCDPSAWTNCPSSSTSCAAR